LEGYEKRFTVVGSSMTPGGLTIMVLFAALFCRRDALLTSEVCSASETANLPGLGGLDRPGPSVR
jgi:hypothetical protein